MPAASAQSALSNVLSSAELVDGTTVVNVYEAKTRLSALLAQVEAGEEVVIARSGRPVARLVRFVAPTGTRLGRGCARGSIVIGPDFDAPLSEFEVALAGEVGPAR